MKLGDRQYVVSEYGASWAVRLKQIVWSDNKPGQLEPRLSTVATCFAQERAEQIAKALNKEESVYT